ncbi:MAG: FAD-dependent oxidoreductase [Clostridia bacterium]
MNIKLIATNTIYGDVMNNSFWIDSVGKLDLKNLNNDISTKVCIIGGGITGISLAYYLYKNNIDFCVLEKDTIGSKTSGNTTAKITSQHGLIYDYLVNSFGIEFAKYYYEANEQAIQNIQNIIEEENIQCDFKLEDSYIYCETENGNKILKNEFETLKKLNISCELVKDISLPTNSLNAIRFPNQASFHPIKYIYGLCNKILTSNKKIYENTKVIDIVKKSSEYEVKTQKHTVKCKYVVIASHYPIKDIPGFYFMKQYQDTSYLIMIEQNTKHFEGIYIKEEIPLLSFRNVHCDNKDYVIIGGSPHKTGTNLNISNSYKLLEETAKKIFPNCKVIYKWNTEDCISLDKIPYIGEFSNFSNNMYVATGYNKWGMTTSNIAANILKDIILGKTNKYEYIYNSKRFNILKNYKEVFNMSKQTINSLIIDKLKIQKDDITNMKNDSSKTLKIKGKIIGIYKDIYGNIYAIKPICSHLKCLLTFNELDKTWDCPCHGSRFDYTGKSIYDPSVKNLDIINIKRLL